MAQRKLGRTADQRKALLRNQVTNLIWYGRKDEDKADWKERTKDVKYPVVEKLFREYGPKFKKRNEEKKCAGGYTRIYKLGPRRGDAAEMCIIEII